MKYTASSFLRILKYSQISIIFISVLNCVSSTVDVTLLNNQELDSLPPSPVCFIVSFSSLFLEQLYLLLVQYTLIRRFSHFFFFALLNVNPEQQPHGFNSCLFIYGLCQFRQFWLAILCYRAVVITEKKTVELLGYRIRPLFI